MGYPKDGQDESEGLAKKINDVLATASAVHSVTISKYGKLIVAVVVWDD